MIRKTMGNTRNCNIAIYMRIIGKVTHTFWGLILFAIACFRSRMWISRVLYRLERQVFWPLTKLGQCRKFHINMRILAAENQTNEWYPWAAKLRVTTRPVPMASLGHLYQVLSAACEHVSAERTFSVVFVAKPIERLTYRGVYMLA